MKLGHSTHLNVPASMDWIFRGGDTIFIISRGTLVSSRLGPGLWIPGHAFLVLAPDRKDALAMKIVCC